MNFLHSHAKECRKTYHSHLDLAEYLEDTRLLGAAALVAAFRAGRSSLDGSASAGAGAGVARVRMRGLLALLTGHRASLWRYVCMRER